MDPRLCTLHSSESHLVLILGDFVGGLVAVIISRECFLHETLNTLHDFV